MVGLSRAAQAAFKVFLSFAVILTITGCGGGTRTTASTGDTRQATLKVTNATGEAVSGALVADINTGDMKTTGADGVVTLTVGVNEQNIVQVQVTVDNDTKDASFSAGDSEKEFSTTLRVTDEGIEVENFESDKGKKGKKGPKNKDTESEQLGEEAIETPTPAPTPKQKPESTKEKEPKAKETPVPTATATPTPQAMSYTLRTNDTVFEPGQEFALELAVDGEQDAHGNLLADYEGKTVIFLVGEESSSSTTLSFSNGFHTFPADSEDPFYMVSYKNYRAVIQNGKARFSFDLPAWLPSGIYRLKVQALVTTSTASYLYGYSKTQSIRLVAP